MVLPVVGFVDTVAVLDMKNVSPYTTNGICNLRIDGYFCRPHSALNSDGRKNRTCDDLTTKDDIPTIRL